jgi:hypothetical protein
VIQIVLYTYCPVRCQEIIFAVIGSQRMIKMDDAPKTISVPEAGKTYYGLSRDGSYEAAKRGEIPTIRVGRLLRVPIVAMERKLDLCGAREEQSR